MIDHTKESKLNVKKILAEEAEDALKKIVNMR